MMPAPTSSTVVNARVNASRAEAAELARLPQLRRAGGVAIDRAAEAAEEGDAERAAEVRGGPEQPGGGPRRAGGADATVISAASG